MRLVDRQVEAIYAVTSVDARHDEAVLTRIMQRIHHRGIGLAVTPCVRPQVRQLAVGDHVGLVRHLVAVTNTQVQLDDTVATVHSFQRIAVGALFGQPALNSSIVAMEVKAVLGALADGIDDLREVLLMEVNIEVVDAIHRNSSTQRIVVVDLLIVLRYGELLLVARRPYVRVRSINR